MRRSRFSSQIDSFIASSANYVKFIEGINGIMNMVIITILIILAGFRDFFKASELYSDDYLDSGDEYLKNRIESEAKTQRNRGVVLILIGIGLLVLDFIVFGK